MLEVIDRLTQEIVRMEREAEKLCKDRYPETGVLRQVKGYMVGAAQYILGPFGPDTELRRFGMKLAERGGKAAKKRAVIAVARKLSVLLHRLWATGEEYQEITKSANGSLVGALSTR